MKDASLAKEKSRNLIDVDSCKMHRFVEAETTKGETSQSRPLFDVHFNAYRVKRCRFVYFLASSASAVVFQAILGNRAVRFTVALTRTADSI